MSKPTDHEVAAFLQELLTYAPGHAEDGRTPAEFAAGRAACFDKARALLERISPSPRAVDPEMPIASLDLPVRFSNLLTRQGINTLGHLLKHDDYDLRVLPGFGRSALTAIEHAVAPYGGLAKNSERAAERRRDREALKQQRIRERAAGADAALKQAQDDLQASPVGQSESVKGLLGSMSLLRTKLATQVSTLTTAIEQQDQPGLGRAATEIERTCHFVDFTVREVRQAIDDLNSVACPA